MSSIETVGHLKAVGLSERFNLRYQQLSMRYQELAWFEGAQAWLERRFP
jgi:hypothetical protein